MATVRWGRSELSVEPEVTPTTDPSQGIYTYYPYPRAAERSRERAARNKARTSRSR